VLERMNSAVVWSIYGTHDVVRPIGCIGVKVSLSQPLRGRPGTTVRRLGATPSLRHTIRRESQPLLVVKWV
jgi:hypothetical protein